jgi:hypothetical protein
MAQRSRRRRESRARTLRALEHTSLDWLVGILATAAALAAVHFKPALDALGQFSQPERLSFYGHLLTVSGFLLAAAGVALASYTTAGGERMNLVRAIAGPRLRRQFVGALTGPALSILLILVAFVLDAAYSFDWSRWVAVASVLFLASRSARLIYYFAGVLRLQDEDREPPKELPSLDDQPLRPVTLRT